jgi:methionine-S-sulfoxide reductase
LAATHRTPDTAPYAAGGQDVSTLRSPCARDALLSPLKRVGRKVAETSWELKLTRTDAEALQVVYDPTKIEYRSLLEFFYKMHDPTTENRQGPDVGTQYRSAIFYHDDEQEKIAKEITKKVDEQWWKGGVSTEVLPAGQWWDAEAYHQKYLDVNPGGYECPSHFLRSFPPLS